MAATNTEPNEMSKWDPGLTERVMGWLRPLIKGYHRAEIRGLESFPPGGALVVANHSGGLFAMDVPVFATGFYEQFGYDRPVYTLSHDIIFTGPTGDFFRRTGFIRANHENADEALRSGGVVVVFPGGDYDVYRPTLSENVIDFDGRTGYVRAALNAGVPIVPAVSIGGQESQLYLSRGMGLAKLLRLDKLMRVEDPADLRGLPVRFVRGAAGERAAADQDRHAGTRTHRCRQPNSGRTPTSTRSTPTSGALCRRRSTGWPKNVVSR